MRCVVQQWEGSYQCPFSNSNLSSRAWFMTRSPRKIFIPFARRNIFHSHTRTMTSSSRVPAAIIYEIRKNEKLRKCPRRCAVEMQRILSFVSLLMEAEFLNVSFFGWTRKMRSLRVLYVAMAVWESGFCCGIVDFTDCAQLGFFILTSKQLLGSVHVMHRNAFGMRTWKTDFSSSTRWKKDENYEMLLDTSLRCCMHVREVHFILSSVAASSSRKRPPFSTTETLRAPFGQNENGEPSSTWRRQKTKINFVLKTSR